MIDLYRPEFRRQQRAAWFENLVLGAAALAVVALGPIACSTEGEASNRRAWGPGSAVVRAEWGREKGEVGHELPEEASPVGPRSLAVDQEGRIYLLDQVNGRIQRW